MGMRVSDLKANAKNPRTITQKKKEMLKNAYHEFGDLGGIVFNQATGSLVSGHQRVKVLDGKTKIKIDTEYKKPTRTGTVKEGFIIYEGERYSYREVLWGAAKEKAAMLAANRTAGDWDDTLLRDFISDIEGDDSIDSDLTMFEAEERKSFFDFGDDEEKEKKPKKEKSRMSSDDVQEIKLTFSKENHEAFISNVEYFQKYFAIENVTDTIFEVLKACRESTEEEEKAGK